MKRFLWNVFVTFSLTISDDPIFNCAYINRLTFARRNFFKILEVESGESAMLTFSEDIDSHLRLMFKALLDQIPV